MTVKTSLNIATRHTRTDWLWYLLIILLCEKIIQHAVVTLALRLDWANIGATVAVSPTLLMILGAVVAVLFIIALWGMITRHRWAVFLAMGLALIDIVGEFVAQGKFGITINVSIIVATVLFGLTLVYSRQNSGRTT